MLTISQNEQPIEKQTETTRDLDVIEIWNTIQGEGPYSGMPATFVRLAGCNLQCPLCDTDYTSTRQLMGCSELVDIVDDLCSGGLVVFTGGEPFRQKALCNVMHNLINRRMTVQVETNGTIWQPDIDPRVAIVCSPKTPTVNADMAKRADCWKYVIQDPWYDNEDGLPTRALGYHHRPARPPETIRKSRIYVQPVDEKDPVANAANQKLATDVCMEHGYRLCLQTQKIVGLR